MTWTRAAATRGSGSRGVAGLGWSHVSPDLVICYCITNYPERGGLTQPPFSGNLLEPANRTQPGSSSRLARGLQGGDLTRWLRGRCMATGVARWPARM